VLPAVALISMLPLPELIILAVPLFEKRLIPTLCAVVLFWFPPIPFRFIVPALLVIILEPLVFEPVLYETMSIPIGKR